VTNDSIRLQNESAERKSLDLSDCEGDEDPSLGSSDSVPADLNSPYRCEESNVCSV